MNARAETFREALVRIYGDPRIDVVEVDGFLVVTIPVELAMEVVADEAKLRELEPEMNVRFITEI